MKDVKVRYADGRITYMPRKTAESRYTVKMGGVIVEETVKVPKRFAPIKPDPVVETDEATTEAPDTDTKEPSGWGGAFEKDQAPKPVKKPRKKRGPNKKKH